MNYDFQFTNYFIPEVRLWKAVKSLLSTFSTFPLDPKHLPETFFLNMGTSESRKVPNQENKAEVGLKWSKDYAHLLGSEFKIQQMRHPSCVRSFRIPNSLSKTSATLLTFTGLSFNTVSCNF